MMNRKLLQIQIMVLVSFLLMVTFAGAVDVAPRISDREIIEKLSVLEAGQGALDQRLTDLRSEMKSGQDALRSEMKTGQDAIDKRFAFIEKLMIALIGLIVSLIAFILWDRMATIRPIETRLKKVESEITSSDGSKMERMIKVMRELSKTDDRLASILRSFSLL